MRKRTSKATSVSPGHLLSSVLPPQAPGEQGEAPCLRSKDRNWRARGVPETFAARPAPPDGRGTGRARRPAYAFVLAIIAVILGLRGKAGI